MRRVLAGASALALIFGAWLLIESQQSSAQTNPVALETHGPSAEADLTPPMPVVAHAASAVSEADVGPDRGRVEVSTAEPDWPQVAKSYLAVTAAPSGDVFHDVLLRFLRDAIEKDSAPQQRNVPLPPKQTVDDLQSDRNINPLAIKLGAREREQLAQMLSEHEGQLRRADRDINITNKMCVSKALLRGDFFLHPADSKENVIAKALNETKGLFDNSSDANAICLPAPDGSKRVVVLSPATSPEYFQAIRGKRALEAEHAVTLRMMFLPSRR